MSRKRPAFQFYPADWRKDPALQSCSLYARGLWIEMMCIMHESDPYGHLCINSRPVSPAQLSRLIGESVAVTARLLDELEAAGVFSRTDAGVIYSRRMVKDEHNRNVRAAGGGKSLQNPNVPRPRKKDAAEDRAEAGGKGAVKVHAVHGGMDHAKDRAEDSRKDTLKDTLPPSFDGSIGVSPSSSSSLTPLVPPPGGRGSPPESGKPPKRARRSQRPADMQPNETHRRIAAEQDVDIDREFVQFCDFHDAKASLFADWDRAFNTWLRNARQYGSPSNGRRSDPDEVVELSEEEFDRLLSWGGRT